MWNSIEETLSAAVERVLTGVASLLPSVMALLLALIVSFVLAWMIRLVLGRALRGIKFDNRLEQWGFSTLVDVSPHKSPTKLVCRIASWLVILFGLLVGLVAVRARFTSQLLLQIFEYLPRLLVALTIVFLGSLLARFLARGVLLSAVNMQIQSARLVSQVVKWLLLVTAYAMALDHLRIGGDILKIAFGLFFGGVVLALALALGLGSRDVVSRAWDKQMKDPPPKEEDSVRHV